MLFVSACLVLIVALWTPALPSDDNRFLMEVHSPDGTSRRVDVSVENGPQLDFYKRIYGKGSQLLVDAEDFPTLARTGLHSEAELEATRTITGRPVEEINRLAKPGAISTAGFLAVDEEILSVLGADNRTVGELGLTHRQLAEPLFHVWNMRLAQYQSEGNRQRLVINHITYNRKRILVQITGSRGFQESIFNDEIRGNSELVIRREPDPEEVQFLSSRYGAAEQSAVLARLTAVHTSEMVSYYIMRYGFYEGHTSYRADPIVIAFLFGLRSIEAIESVFPGKLPAMLAGLMPPD